MAWSTPFSETIGGIIGTATGYLASEFVKSQIENSNMARGTQKFMKPLASALTATSAHLLAGGTTKALINGSMLDPIGGGISAVTTPTTALAHGIYELTNEFGKEFSKKATSEVLKLSKKKK